MKSETLSLSGALDQNGAMDIARALNAVNGVSKVSVTTASASVAVDFNDDITSVQELRATLQRAGFNVKRAAHGTEGMCCGSCGG